MQNQPPSIPQRREYLHIVLPAHFPCVGEETIVRDAPLTYLHFHNCLEIGYCHEGSGVFVVGEKILPFSAGDVSVINETEVHLARSAAGTSSHWTFLMLDPSSLVRTPVQTEVLRTGTLCGRQFPNILTSQAFPAIGTLVNEMLAELQEREDGYEAAVRGLVWAVMARVQRVARVMEPSPAPVRHALERIIPALNYLSAHYAVPVRVEALAAICATSPTNLRRWFQAALGQSPQDYLTRLRLQMASALLQNTDRTVLDIAIDVGYPSVSSFNRQFKAIMGCSPRQWRANPVSNINY